MVQLPLVIKRDVRDKFDGADTPIQQQVLTLKDTLGLPVHLDVNWSLLWAEYEQSAVDKAAFVPYIIPYVVALLSALSEKLDEDGSSWTDEFLELLTQCQGLRLDLQTCKENNTSIRWLDGKGLLLYIPIAPATASTPSCQSMLGHLESLFAEPTRASNPLYQASRPSTSSSSLDDINTPMSLSTFSSDFPLSKPNLVAEASPFPKLETLPRPDQLLSQPKLYIIHMRIERNRQHLIQTLANSSLQHLPDRIIIQSTHEPSLKLIHDYFTKWTRADGQTREKVPLMRHTLYASAIGHSYQDTLVVEPFSQVSARSGSVLNPALYQCFIEGTLGYEVVYRSASEGFNGTNWEFRRSRAFA